MDSEPVYTEQQAAILAVVASLQTELRLTREQQGRDSALFREQATKDNAAIVFQLDKLNTSDSRHGEWIAGHIKECEAREKRIKDLEDVVTTTPTCRAMQQEHERRLVGVEGLLATHDTTLKEVRGGWKLITFVAVLCSSITALIYHLIHLHP